VDQEREPDRRQAVVDAASVCFEQFGIAKTSMQNIAAAAGVSRRALYRAFPSRQSLVDAVLEQRLTELIEKVLPTALASATFEEGFVEGALAAIAYIRATPDLRRLLRETSIDEACRSMLQEGAELSRLAASLWQPILDWGRGRGEVRSDLIDREFIELTATIMLVYSAREDISAERLRSVLRSYLQPVVAAGSVEPATARPRPRR
jgi:AcrR family transcriptional regulator